MPHMLQLEHYLPFAVMGDEELKRLDELVAAGADFVIEVYKPSPDIARQLPGQGYIAYVKPAIKETDDDQDNQAVAEPS